LMLFFTGSSRTAASVLKHQEAACERGDADALASLHAIKAMAARTIDLLQAGELDAFGHLLHESWLAKKRLARGITNARIDAVYEMALEHGAIGGKIAGAGGGGFLMLYAEPTHHEGLTRVLEDAGLHRMDFRFERGGAVVLLDAVPRGVALSAR
jgi:galactokinase/mevalonate kinase-like predicted kinase